MNSYQRAGRAFEEAYRKQLQAQDMQRRDTEEDTAIFGDNVRSATNFEAGQPIPAPAGPGNDGDPFSSKLDTQVDKVEETKSSLLKSARQRANALAPQDY